MKYIIISGIDGAGKTSVITALEKTLEDQGKTYYYIWLRYNHYLVKVLHAFARVIGLSVKVHNENGDFWQHRFYKSQLFCNLYILCTYIDNNISLLKLRKIPKQVDYIICDRWINDIIIDLGTKTHKINFLESKWAYRFYKLLPKNSFQLLISRNKQDVLNCRTENVIDPDFDIRYDFYNKLQSKKKVHLINNNGSIDKSVRQILKVIKEETNTNRL